MLIYQRFWTLFIHLKSVFSCLGMIFLSVVFLNVAYDKLNRT
ncbi:hypothetical protein D347_02757 [Enterococcus faecalis LA3B-2]|nr:hypothetical protein D347_02757 [Enterococcus faecalis LA3B-2]